MNSISITYQNGWITVICDICIEFTYVYIQSFRLNDVIVSDWLSDALTGRFLLSQLLSRIEGEIWQLNSFKAMIYIILNDLLGI